MVNDRCTASSILNHLHVPASATQRDTYQSKTTWYNVNNGAEEKIRVDVR